MPSNFVRAGALAIALAIGAYAVFSLTGSVPALLHRQEEIRGLEQENARLAKENEARRERIKRLDESQSEQEMVIRERLKLVKPNEKVYVLPEKK